MSTSKRRSIYGLNPLYAVIGATDLAAEKLREIGANAVGETALPSADSTTDAKGELRRMARGARQLPVLALNEALDVVVRSQEQFSELADRGERLAKRRPAPVQQTEDLLHRAGRTVARGQARASKVAHEAADRTRDRATTTLHSAREQADEVVDAVTHLGRASSPTTLLRRGSVARPVRGTISRTVDTDSERPKPRRPRVSSGSARSGEEGRSRPVPAAGSGVEAGATLTRAKKETESTSTSTAPKSAGKSSPASTRPASGAAKKVAAKKTAARKPAAKKAPAKTTRPTAAGRSASATASATSTPSTTSGASSDN